MLCLLVCYLFGLLVYCYLVWCAWCFLIGGFDCACNYKCWFVCWFLLFGCCWCWMSVVYCCWCFDYNCMGFGLLDVDIVVGWLIVLLLHGVNWTWSVLWIGLIIGGGCHVVFAFVYCAYVYVFVVRLWVGFYVVPWLCWLC